MSADKPDVLFARPLYSYSLDEVAGFYAAHKLWEAEDPDALLAAIAPTCRAAVTRAVFTEDWMTKLPQLGIIAVCGVGYEGVEIEAASAPELRRWAQKGSVRVFYELQRQIQESAYAYQRAVDAGDQTVVGVNRFTTGGGASIPTLRVRPEVEAQHDWFRLIHRRDDPRTSLFRAFAETMAEYPLS